MIVVFGHVHATNLLILPAVVRAPFETLACVWAVGVGTILGASPSWRSIGVVVGLEGVCGLFF